MNPVTCHCGATKVVPGRFNFLNGKVHAPNRCVDGRTEKDLPPGPHKAGIMWPACPVCEVRPACCGEICHVCGPRAERNPL